MTDKNDIAAFPRPASWTPDGQGYDCGDQDMSLRDYFAAQALPVCRDTLPDWDLTALFGKERSGIRREEIIAAEAYRLADAMLAERSKP